MIIMRRLFTRIEFSLIISLLLFAAAGSFAAVSPTQNLLQDADAVNLKIEKRYTINPDGSYTLRLYIKRRILTYKGKKNYADFKFNYNRSRQKVRLLKAQTTTAKGAVLTVKPEEIHDIPAPWNSEVSLYSKSRQMVVSLPAVEPGSEIEVELELQSKNGFWCQENFRLNDPIIDKTVTIDAPASIKLHSRAPQSLQLIQQQLKTGSNTIRYQWQGKNIPALTPERGAPPLPEQGFCLLISTFSDWQQVAKLFQQSFFNAQNSNNNRISPIKFDNSDDNSPTSDQLYRQLRKLTIYEISFQETDWTIQSPANTRRLGYGTDCDLALLFLNQLKLRQQPARIVMVNSQNHFLEKFADFPYPGWWDTALVKSRSDFFLFSSEKSAPGITGYDGRVGLDLESGKIIKIKDRTPDRMTTRLQLNLMQFPSCRGELVCRLEGATATTWRAQWRDLSTPEKEIAALQLLHQIDPQAEFTEKISITGLHDDRKHLSFKCKFKLKMAGTKLTYNSLTAQFLLLPIRAPELPSHLKSILRNRLLPLTITNNLAIVNQIIIRLPDDYTFIAAPPATSGTLPGFSWQIKSKFNPANNKLTYNRIINLHRKIIQSQTSNYNKLINTVRSLFYPDALRIIFATNTTATYR